MLGDPRLPERFWAKVAVNDETGCWTWNAAKNGDGYGHVRFNGKTCSAHRAAYLALVGPIPAGYELDHAVCRTRSCCNPAHLEPVTHAENVRRGRAPLVQASKTHCPKGHPYDEKNTRIKNGKRGRQRMCRACESEWNRAYHYAHPDRRRKKAA